MFDVVYSTATPEEPYLNELERFVTNDLYVTLILVTLGGILRFVTQVGKKDFRFYFAKACCKIMVEKEEGIEKLRYLRLTLDSYNKYLRRNLRANINHLNEIYSRIISKDDEERNQILKEVCNSLNNDKINLARYLSSLYNVPDSELFLKESIFQQFVSKGWFAISNIEHKELVTQMRQARFKDNGNLDKEETNDNTFDSFDATRLALKMYYTGARR